MRLLALITVTLLTVSCSSKNTPEQPLNETFNDTFHSGFAAALNQLDNADIVLGDGVGGTDAVRVLYVGYPRGSERVLFNQPLYYRSDYYELSFDVKFCDNFDFARGGKLHGLGPAQPVTGGNQVSADGWSARAMWGTGGILKTYTYHQNLNKKYGDTRIAKDFRFVPGEYYHVTYKLQLNQPSGAYNGWFAILVNGKERVRQDNVQFRSVEIPESKIQTFLFNTFHGGSDPSWAPRNADKSYKIDCALFDNFRVKR